MYCVNSELLMQLVRFIIEPTGLLGNWGDFFYFQGAGEHCNYFRVAGEQPHSFRDLETPVKKVKNECEKSHINISKGKASNLFQFFLLLFCFCWHADPTYKV